MRKQSDWQALRQQARRLSGATVPGQLAADPARADDFAIDVGPLHANFARQGYDRTARDALFAMADDAELPKAFRALFNGAMVNVSEARPALHTALRTDLGQGAVATAARAQALQARERMAEMVAELEASNITDVINVGIGGSDLGPRLAVQALEEFHNGRFRVHFLNNADASGVHGLLPRLDPARTAVVLVSKSFSTQETLLNGAIARDWLGGRGRLYAITSSDAKAAAFGVPASRVLPMWDWVGGRYSLWSSVGFVVALALGMARFQELLDGAAEMDAHVLACPPASNLAIWHALTMAWNRNACGLGSHAVLPYHERLALLPDYLQQLVMESLGKNVGANGEVLADATVPVLWGGTGTNSQHSFFQALHQGSNDVPADFIGVIAPAHRHDQSQHWLLANLLAQSEALANGDAGENPQKHYPGRRPDTMFLLDALTPRSLGALLAMYEHSVYALSVLWGINAFDQWGVERGKILAASLFPALSSASDDDSVTDPVTRALIRRIRRAR